MKLLTEIKSIQYNAIWVWTPRGIFNYLPIETSGKQINLWVKLKLVTQTFTQFVGKLPLSTVIQDPRHFVYNLVFSPIMWLEEIQKLSKMVLQ